MEIESDEMKRWRPWQFILVVVNSTDEFGLACNRLKNARRYLIAREVGGARWELNTLRTETRSQLEAEVADGRTQRRRNRSS